MFAWHLRLFFSFKSCLTCSILKKWWLTRMLGCFNTKIAPTASPAWPKDYPNRFHCSELTLRCVSVSQFNPIPEIWNLLLAILIIPEIYSSSQNYTYHPRTILIIPELYSSSQNYTHHPRPILIIPELYSSCPKLFRVVLSCVKLLDSLFPNGFFVRFLTPIQYLFPYFRYCYGSQLYSCCSASCPLGK